MSAWDWLKGEIAARLGPDAAAELWAEYRRRAALDLLAAQRRDHEDKLARARVALARGERWAARAVAKHQQWLEEH